MVVFALDEERNALDPKPIIHARGGLTKLIAFVLRGLQQGSSFIKLILLD